MPKGITLSITEKQTKNAIWECTKKNADCPHEDLLWVNCTMRLARPNADMRELQTTVPHYTLTPATHVTAAKFTCTWCKVNGVHIAKNTACQVSEPSLAGSGRLTTYWRTSSSFFKLNNLRILDARFGPRRLGIVVSVSPGISCSPAQCQHIEH